eukprot:6180884-Pleurochrysis_carterae.AAC.2
MPVAGHRCWGRSDFAPSHLRCLLRCSQQRQPQRRADARRAAHLAAAAAAHQQRRSHPCARAPSHSPSRPPSRDRAPPPGLAGLAGRAHDSCPSCARARDPCRDRDRSCRAAAPENGCALLNVPCHAPSTGCAPSSALSSDPWRGSGRDPCHGPGHGLALAHVRAGLDGRAHALRDHCCCLRWRSQRAVRLNLASCFPAEIKMHALIIKMGFTTAAALPDA